MVVTVSVDTSTVTVSVRITVNALKKVAAQRCSGVQQQKWIQGLKKQAYMKNKAFSAGLLVFFFKTPIKANI